MYRTLNLVSLIKTLFFDICLITVDKPFRRRKMLLLLMLFTNVQRFFDFYLNAPSMCSYKNTIHTEAAFEMDKQKQIRRDL